MAKILKQFQRSPYRTHLIKLAGHLESLRTGKRAKLAFDMAVVAYSTKKQEFVDNGPRSINDFCGTVCCAVGSMPFSPYFRKQGFEFDWVDDTVCGILRNRSPFSLESGCLDYFGLDLSETVYLFASGSYMDRPTPKIVAKRIRDLVKTGEQS